MKINYIIDDNKNTLCLSTLCVVQRLTNEPHRWQFSSMKFHCQNKNLVFIFLIHVPHTKILYFTFGKEYVPKCIFSINVKAKVLEMEKDTITVADIFN